LGRLALALGIAGALAVGSVGWSTTVGAQSSETFLASDYGSGASLSDVSYCWRGWAFEVNEDTEVSALIGGGVTASANFLGAIWEGSYDGATDTLTIGSVVAEVTFPDGMEQSVALPTPVTLTAGQVYVMGMGLSDIDEGIDSMYQVDDFDSTSIPSPTGVISNWYSPSSSEAYAIGDAFADDECWGPAANASGLSYTADDSTGTNPAMGFTYAVTPEPTTTTTQPAPEPTTTTSTTQPTTPTTAPAGAAATPKFTG
jgi:hypothetical protein